MSEHPREVEGFENNLIGLVLAANNSSFIESLATDLEIQSKRDREKGRTQVSSKLHHTARILLEARKFMTPAPKSKEALARKVGNLTYDQTAHLIERIADMQALQRNYTTAERLYDARDALFSTWKICKPYTNQQFNL